tara:strand:- start:5601 stop:6731 length:1131 start_codon:yes stop_codon:yes gene_type:complete
MKNYAAIAALLFSAFLILTSVLGFWSLRWDASQIDESPVPHFSVGPFNDGGSFEQEMVSQTEFLSWVRMFLHSDDKTNTSQTGLVFRLRDEEDRLVREARFSQVLGLRAQPVTWRFDPVKTDAGRIFSLQVVVEHSEEDIYALASLSNPLPGSIVTNGDRAGDHVDLVLVPGRNINGWLILEVISDNVIGGLGSIAVYFVAIPMIFSWGMITLTGSASRRAWFCFGMLALGVAVFAAWSGLFLLRNEASPESSKLFWAIFTVAPGVLAISPWMLYSHLLMRRDTFVRLLNDKKPHSTALTCATILTGLAALLMGLTAIEIVPWQAFHWDYVNPFQGRIEVVDYMTVKVVAFMALVSWVLWGLIEMIRFFYEQPSSE